MNIITRLLLRKGLVTDLARVPHSLDLSSPNMASTINSALKPLETLSRIVNHPPVGLRGIGRIKNGAHIIDPRSASTADATGKFYSSLCCLCFVIPINTSKLQSPSSDLVTPAVNSFSQSCFKLFKLDCPKWTLANSFDILHCTALPLIWCVNQVNILTFEFLIFFNIPDLDRFIVQILYVNIIHWSTIIWTRMSLINDEMYFDE